MGCRFRVLGLGFKFKVFRFRVLGFQVLGFSFRVQSLGPAGHGIENESYNMIQFQGSGLRARQRMVWRLWALHCSPGKEAESTVKLQVDCLGGHGKAARAELS